MGIEANKFEEMLAINVNEKTEKRNGFTYLSWAWAWGEFKKANPEASYEIERFDGKPYLYDEELGYIVFTNVTANGQTLSMWLPVMNGANKAMKDKPYNYTTKYGEKSVEQASMFDINKTIMRCLVKNLAMFGLGLYIYAGEDLPEFENEEIELKKTLIKKLGSNYDVEEVKLAIKDIGKATSADCSYNDLLEVEKILKNKK